MAVEAPGLQRPEAATINLPVLAFAAGATALTTLLFGHAPAAAAARPDVSAALKPGG